MTEFKFSGKDLINRWGIEWFEFINYVRISDGELQPYNSRGNLVIDPTTEHGDKVFRKLLEKRPDFIESAFQQKIPDYILNENHPEYQSPKLKRYTNDILIYTVLHANNCVIDRFTIPTDEIDAEIYILSAGNWLFKTADVLAFEKKHGLGPSLKHTANDLPEPVSEVEQISNETSPDDFVKKLVLHPVSDEEIRFQFGQKKVTFTLDRLGKKQRKALKEILGNPKYLYSLGPSRYENKQRVEEYDRRKDRIKQISKKFIDFFNKELDARIPTTLFLFERCRKEGTGKYKPIFKIAGSIDREKEIAKLREKTKSELFKELKKAIKNSSNYCGDNFKFITEVLAEKGVKDEELTEFIKSAVPDGQVIKGYFDENQQYDPQ